MASLGSRRWWPNRKTLSRLSAPDVLVIAAWCGLAVGEFEVAARLRVDEIHGMTRNFVWLGPLINLALFLGVAVALILPIRLWPRRGAWASTRLIVLLAAFESLAMVIRTVRLDSLLVLAMGITVNIAPVIDRILARWRHWVVLSLPVLLGLVAVQGSLLVGIDWIKARREARSPLPPNGLPNVLLIVMDTTRADHLSLYGYKRPTTPNLERLAQHGIRFDQARAAAPWTLPSHATMFTGKWPHELDVNWIAPLRADAPTLAEYLGSLGYATAGFVGNTRYCASGTGLDRGFAYYRDYVLNAPNAANSVHLVQLLLNRVGGELGRMLSISSATRIKWCQGERKAAPTVNREFLGWLSHHRDVRRPFFVFLNYIDAHDAYILPSDGSHRFGATEPTDADLAFLAFDWAEADKRHVSPTARALALDGYDNCLAYLDEHLGRLFDNLERRGVLDQTLVIVTADHGEGFGRHGLFNHGVSLYRPEIHVPLLVVLPSDRRASRRAVNRVVSLRDLPATIVDVLDLGENSPFPGQSLARWWSDRMTETPPAGARSVVLSELAAPNPTIPNQGRSPACQGPLVSLAEGDFVYIRNQGNGAEELYNERVDPAERHDLAGIETMRPVLRRFRDWSTQAVATNR